MRYHKDSQLKADTQQYEPIFILRVIWIKEPNSALVEENSLRLFERDAVLALVRLVLLFIPLKPNIGHMYKVHYLFRKSKLLIIEFIDHQGELRSHIALFIWQNARIQRRRLLPSAGFSCYKLIFRLKSF